MYFYANDLNVQLLQWKNQKERTAQLHKLRSRSRKLFARKQFRKSRRTPIMNPCWRIYVAQSEKLIIFLNQLACCAQLQSAFSSQYIMFAILNVLSLAQKKCAKLPGQEKKKHLQITFDAICFLHNISFSSLLCSNPRARARWRRAHFQRNFSQKRLRDRNEWTRKVKIKRARKDEAEKSERCGWTFLFANI